MAEAEPPKASEADPEEAMSQAPAKDTEQAAVGQAAMTEGPAKPPEKGPEEMVSSKLAVESTADAGAGISDPPSDASALSPELGGVASESAGTSRSVPTSAVSEPASGDGQPRGTKRKLPTELANGVVEEDDDDDL
jgi:hypothetical protein